MHNVSIHFVTKECPTLDLQLIAAYQTITKKGSQKTKTLDVSHWNERLQKEWEQWPMSASYEGGAGKTVYFTKKNGETILVVGMGEKSKVTSEKLRSTLATLYGQLKDSPYKKIGVHIESFNSTEQPKQIEKIVSLFSEAIHFTQYQFNKYLSEKKESLLHFHFLLSSTEKKTDLSRIMSDTETICSGVLLARDLINEPPNILNSEVLAKLIVNDVKKELGTARVKVTVLDKKQITKEKMNLLLCVNDGSAFDPRVVHLTYTPKKVTKATKHIALVGKGLTFDSGGYSLKTGAGMKGMKFDMAGAATVYGAFRNAVKLNSTHKISCFLGITDNMVSPLAVTPDAIITGRSGKTVEILNTDAEGRLVLADILDYACDTKPDAIIDVATLTGACIRALGSVCGIMGNNQPLIDTLLNASKTQDEPMWQLPLLDDYRDDMKGTISDLRNVGTSAFAGAQRAAIFLEHFVKEGIAWAHLDIAGIEEVSRPYCPKGSASGWMVRTLTKVLIDADPGLTTK